MPSCLESPLLMVDAGKMHKIDPGNVESLFGMWTVFSKCAESIEGGKRLENLTWRLWNRETFCCEAKPRYSPLPEIRVSQRRPSKKEIPALSTSVDSADSRLISEPVTSSNSPPLSEDLALSRSRGKEKHITPSGLEKMVYNIKAWTELAPLPPSVAANVVPIFDETPRPSSPSPQIEPLHKQRSATIQTPSDSCHSATTVDGYQESDHRGSDTSVSSGGLIKSGSIVHGFSPSPFTSCMRAKLSPELATLTPEESSTKPDPGNKKKAGMFTLGGSSGDDESSFEDHMCKRPIPSSLTDRLKHPEVSSRPNSFRAMLQSRQIRPISEGKDGDEDEGAIETDEEDEEEEEDEEVDESAIEEDDDSDWEDSVVESGKSSVAEDKPDFKRVDSRPNLVSRKSLLTRGLHEPQRAAALAEAAMKSSATLGRSRIVSSNGPSLPASPIQDNGHRLSNLESEPTRSKPITCSASQVHLPAHSPRTTRRNMLATELTESLRRHLLWERQQKSTTANAVYKRRHTAHKEMANLHEFPGPKAVQPIVDASKTNSWSQHFDYGPWEYHTKGW